MDHEELKRKLMGLWEKTSHVSKESIHTLFDYYFDAEYVIYKEIEGKIISALCGIPYKFGFGRNRLSGLYIIALTSEEGYRKKGILEELLSDFNEKVKEEFDFTFIVPHTDLMADYYGTQGYLSSFFFLEERFTPLHDFCNDYSLHVTDSDERIRSLKLNLLNEIRVEEFGAQRGEESAVIQFIENIERKGASDVNLVHTTRDIEYLLMVESSLNLRVFVARDDDGKITGVAFTHTEEIKRVKVIGYYVSDTCSYYALMDYIKHFYPDFSLSIETIDPKYQTVGIVQQTYVSTNPAGGDLDNTFSQIDIPINRNRLLQPKGMVRLLSFKNILQYIAERHSEADFKLIIRDYAIENSGENELYTVKNGKLITERVSDTLKDPHILYLSIKEISELLLRKKDSSNLIMEAFGIPRLSLQMKLLPY